MKNQWKLKKIILNNYPSSIVFFLMERNLNNNCGDYIEIEESRRLNWWERTYYRLIGKMSSI